MSSEYMAAQSGLGRPRSAFEAIVSADVELMLAWDDRHAPRPTPLGRLRSSPEAAASTRPRSAFEPRPERNWRVQPPARSPCAGMGACRRFEPAGSDTSLSRTLPPNRPRSCED